MDETRRIILLGKTGCGKSSLANTIFGEDVFKVSSAFQSETIQCRAETRAVRGRRLTLIDTPGFFDTDATEEELRAEMMRCAAECAPGPHAFLILLKLETFTSQESHIIKQVQDHFSEEAFQYSVVVFTRGDNLPEGTTLKDVIQENQDVSDVVSRCGGRCHVFDNKHWKNDQHHEYRSNCFQVGELLTTIEKMVEEHHGGFYTNDMLQQVETKIQEEVEDIRLKSAGQTDDEIRQQAKTRASVFLRRCTRRLMLGALQMMMGSLVPLAKTVASEPADAGGSAAVEGGETPHDAGCGEVEPAASARDTLHNKAKGALNATKKSLKTPRRQQSQDDEQWLL